jgi:hypothetical protein
VDGGRSSSCLRTAGVGERVLSAKGRLRMPSRTHDNRRYQPMTSPAFRRLPRNLCGRPPVAGLTFVNAGSCGRSILPGTRGDNASTGAIPAGTAAAPGRTHGRRPSSPRRQSMGFDEREREHGELGALRSWPRASRRWSPDQLLRRTIGPAARTIRCRAGCPITPSVAAGKAGSKGRGSPSAR